MSGDIRAVEIRRERELPDGAGGHVEGYAIRVWVDDGDGDETLGLTVTGPHQGVDGDLGRIFKDELVDGWIELVMGNR